jgi:hypothetical protein
MKFRIHLHSGDRKCEQRYEDVQKRDESEKSTKNNSAVLV